ncbi:MOSC domain-containing protein [Saccharopolyspora taberi]|uniref:MOSC domain-containing protein n=1 Tax=Saccharopolyspora taberi TaxID=60895 RepID=A0ABN3V6U8_9PSEU
MGYVESVNVAVVWTGAWTGRAGRTGIDKRPVTGPVEFTGTGVTGDSVCDTKHHGAWYQAAYSFDVEELRYWSAELGRELVPGNAGENLSLTGQDTSAAVIGERWRIGSAVLRVTGPRQPCRVFQGFWDVEQFIKLFTEHGRPGAYLAVEEAGRITAGDGVEVISRPEHGVTVGDVFALTMQRRGELSEHVAPVLPDLPEKWRAKVAKAL